MKKKRCVGHALAAVTGALALSLSCQADAAMVVYQNTAFAAGDQVSYSTDAFSISDPGTYQATLTDFKFPAPLQELGLILTTAGTQEVNRLDKPGSFVFSVSAPGTYDASMYALAGGTLQLGLYGVSVALDNGAVVPTPLPPAALLLGSALLVVVASGRRGRRRIEAGTGPRVESAQPGA